MYESGAVDTQNGESWSRGLPASWVMMVLSRSTARARSARTRYGLRGTSSEVSFGRHSASHGSRTALISSATGAGSRGAETRDSSSPSSASRTSFASPISACSHATSLLMSIGSSVACTIALPAGMSTPKLVLVKLQPMPKIRSALCRKWCDRRRDGVAARAERQHVVLRKRALAAEAAGDRGGEQLGEPLQLGPGARVVHALAGVDYRTPWPRRGAGRMEPTAAGSGAMRGRVAG